MDRQDGGRILRTDSYHAFMLDHAVGALPPALQVAGELHCTLHPGGAEEAGLWACIGGVLLDQAGGGAADGMDTRARRRRPRRGGGADTRAIRAAAGAILTTDLDALGWRRGLTGVDYAGAGLANGQFMRLDAGQATPEHGHSALEATVVLRGELCVGTETYPEGGLVIGAPGERHQPKGSGDGPCICYVGRQRRPFWRLS